MVARFTMSLLAFASMAIGAAQAADYPQPYYPPPPLVIPQPQFASGWYLRGQVGVGLVRSDQVQFIKNPATVTDFAIDHSSISDSVFIGGGAGYEFNNWLRFDGTVEYRTKSHVSAFGSYTTGCTSFNGFCLDTYDGNLNSWIFLANAYVDLGTWNCFTPFVGAGIGGAYNSLVDFTDVNPSVGGRGIGRNSSEWHLAWALYAGVAYELTKTFKVELAYRYLNFGSITDTIDCVGGCRPDSYKFGNLYSHDFMLGLRWTCCELPPPPPPVVFEPPPLRSRG